MSVGMRPNDSRSGTGDDTLAAVDEIDGEPYLVVADVTRDDAWCAVSADDVAVLAEWR